jgi:hypothetical protein
MTLSLAISDRDDAAPVDDSAAQPDRRPSVRGQRIELDRGRSENACRPRSSATTTRTCSMRACRTAGTLRRSATTARGGIRDARPSGPGMRRTARRRGRHVETKALDGDGHADRAAELPGEEPSAAEREREPARRGDERRGGEAKNHRRGPSQSADWESTIDSGSARRVGPARMRWMIALVLVGVGPGVAHSRAVDLSAPTGPCAPLAPLFRRAAGWLATFPRRAPVRRRRHAEPVRRTVDDDDLRRAFAIARRRRPR